jgi:beta-glucanase (GH16 family)
MPLMRALTMMAAVALALAAWLVRAADAPPPPNLKPLDSEGRLAAYALVWHDEFDGDKLDIEAWKYRRGKRLLGVNLPDNVSVADGCLRLALKKEPAEGLAYTCGGVISQRLFQYGYFEARFMCPPGAGWHTSFWTDYDGGGTADDAHKQEIDICEQDSVHLDRYSAGVIDWSVEPQKDHGRQWIAKCPDLSADFHVWGCEFTPTVVRFFFDGKLTHQCDATKFPHGRASVWLTSVPALLGGTKKVDDSQLPAVAVFDWVRVYEAPGG